MPLPFFCTFFLTRIGMKRKRRRRYRTTGIPSVAEAESCTAVHRFQATSN